MLLYVNFISSQSLVARGPTSVSDDDDSDGNDEEQTDRQSADDDGDDTLVIVGPALHLFAVPALDQSKGLYLHWHQLEAQHRGQVHQALGVTPEATAAFGDKQLLMVHQPRV